MDLLTREPIESKHRRRLTPLLGAVLLAALGPSAHGQTQGGTGTPSTAGAPAQSAKTGAEASAPYVRPTEKTKIQNYFLDSFGLYPLVGAGVAAGINQFNNSPPEWGQGAEGYGDRYASNLGINLVATTTRYGLAEIFREDTIYYACECRGFFPRFGHALASTFLARKGEDGHRVFSFPKIAAPYAGTMTAALGWYPARYSEMDGFRMGNYLIAAYAGGNLLREFILGGPHALIKKMPFSHY